MSNGPLAGATGLLASGEHYYEPGYKVTLDPSRTRLTIFFPHRLRATTANPYRLAFTTKPLDTTVLERSRMWLDGDPKLLAYFLLNTISGVLCTLLLISFGATKIRRYSIYTLSQLSDALTIIPCLGDQNSWWLISMLDIRQRINPSISQYWYPRLFLG